MAESLSIETPTRIWWIWVGLYRVSICWPLGWWWRTPGPEGVVGREAMVKVYGVVMAMVQGHSWVPIRSIGDK